MESLYLSAIFTICGRLLPKGEFCFISQKDSISYNPDKIRRNSSIFNEDYQILDLLFIANGEIQM